jgi:hypothetical protein
MSEQKTDFESSLDEEFDNLGRLQYAEGLRFLIEKEIVADFEYWAKVPSWSIKDTALLINGIDPVRAQLNGDYLIKEGKRFIHFQDYERASRILNSAAESGEMHAIGHPLFMLNQVMRRGIHYQFELADAVVAESKKIREFDMQIAKSGEEANQKLQRANEAAEVAERNADVKLQAGERKLKNVYRTLGIVLQVWKDRGMGQKLLKTRMETLFDYEAPENVGKGLKGRTIDGVFSEANKAYKELIGDEECWPE